MVAVLAEVRRHAAWIRPMVWLGQAEAAHPLSAGELRQELSALLFRAVFPNRVHHQRALHRRRGPQPAVAPLQLLHQEAVGNLVKACPPVFRRDVGPERADLAKSRQQVLRERTPLRRILDDGANFLLDPGPGRLTNQLVLLREQVVEQVVVVPLVQICAHGAKIRGASPPAPLPGRGFVSGVHEQPSLAVCIDR